MACDILVCVCVARVARVCLPSTEHLPAVFPLCSSASPRR